MSKPWTPKIYEAVKIALDNLMTTLHNCHVRNYIQTVMKIYNIIYSLVPYRLIVYMRGPKGSLPEKNWGDIITY